MSVIDKALNAITGIFTETTEPQTPEPINTPEQQKLVDVAMGDYQFFKAARQKIEGIWRQEQRFYRGDHWYGLRPPEVSKIRPNSIDNVCWSQIESMTSKVAGWMPEPDFEAQEPGDEQKAQDLNDFMPYELRCISFKQKYVRAVRRMLIHGPIGFKVVYDPTVEGGTGQNRYLGNNDIIPLDLGSFFPDPRIRDFIYLQKAAANIIHTIHPIEYFAERYGDQGKKVQPDNFASDVEIFDQDDYTQKGFSTDRAYLSLDGQNQRCGKIEYWYRGKPKLMTAEDKALFKQLGDDKLAEGKDPSECYAKAKGSMKGVHCLTLSTSGVFLEHKSYIYDHGMYPFTVRVLFPDEDNPWGKGYMRDMMSPQIMLNKFAEIAVETMAKQGNSGIVYDEQAITKPQKWKEQRSLPGAMLPISNISGFKELQGVNVPNTVFEMLNYYKDMLQKIPGQFDSANGQANPNVTSGEQAKALISASSTRLGLATEVIEDALQDVFMQYIELIAQFYTSNRIARVTERQVTIGRDSLINTAPTNYDTGNGEIPVMEEYVPQFDISVNIGVEKPKDREYNIQMAFNLFKMVDPTTNLPFIDAEAVEYTVQNGRMEPFSVIKQRMQKEQEQMQQMQQMQQQMAQMQQENAILNEQVNQLHGMVSQTERQNMQSTADTLHAINQHDELQHKKQMDAAKLGLDAAKVAVMGRKQAVMGGMGNG